MCGISGIAGSVGLTLERLQPALDAIFHRGPDGQGILATAEAVLGMRRLAIIDLCGGDQPIYNEDKTLAVTCNGEIYNYRELRSELQARGHQFRTESDTEVLVHLYEERGPQMVQALRGMFAFSIYHLPEQRLFLARDRFGKKPLYYTCPRQGGLLYASELKALRPLAQAAGEQWQINPQAIYDYLSLGVVPQPSTIFENVFCLPAGHWLSFEQGKLHIEQYWQPTFEPKLDLSYPEAQEQTRWHLREAVRLRLRSDVPLGIFLSGGVDSSVIAYEAAQEAGEQLHTFTVNTGQGFDESPVAQRTARALGIQNEVLHLQPNPLEGLQTVVRHYDQPFADSSAIPSLEISRLARERVTVVLNGDGGDEVFAGYRRYVAAYRSARWENLAGFLGKAISVSLGALSGSRRSGLGFAARFARGMVLPPAARYLIWTSDMLLEEDKQRYWRGPPCRPTEKRVAQALNLQLSTLDRQLSADVQINLLSDLLVKMDMATMAHSLEGRSPFMDHVLAEFAWKLPDEYRVRDGVPKAVLRDAYRGRLPDEVIEGAKRGFEIPLQRWLSRDLRPLLLDTVGHSQALVRNYLDGAFINALLRRDALLERNWAYIVYALLVLELWLQQEANHA